MLIDFKRTVGFVLLLGSLIVLLSGVLLINGWLTSELPLERTVTVKIKSGMSGEEIADLLHEKDAIYSPRAFRWALWFKQAERDLRQGTVKLRPFVTLNELIERLREKRPLLTRVQLQEGWPSWKMFRVLSRELDLPRSRFYELFQDPRFIKKMGIKSQTLEGYLFPETYYVSVDAKPRDVLKQLLDQFHETKREIGLLKKSRSLDISLNDTVKLASLIAREAKVDRERHLVSAVYHNRLRDGIALQADPTLLYPLKNFDATITRSMIETDNSYNSYRNKGLPPTPISNPGKKSLRASVEPADVPYRYFVSRGDGTHKFSETLQEHQRAVRKYQR